MLLGRFRTQSAASRPVAATWQPQPLGSDLSAAGAKGSHRQAGLLARGDGLMPNLFLLGSRCWARDMGMVSSGTRKPSVYHGMQDVRGADASAQLWWSPA